MIIDTEFSGLLQSLSSTEYKILEKSIVEEGCLVPLVVWGGTLVDGHNRYSICQKHDIKFKEVKKEFKDRDAVLNWIDNNQLGRRNLSGEQYSLIQGRMLERIKKSRGGDQRANRHSDGLVGPPENVAKAIAEEHNVSPSTVERNGRLVRSIEKLKDVEPDLEYTFASGDGPSRNKINAAAKVVKDDPEKAKKILKGEKVTLVQPTEGDLASEGDAPEQGIDLAHKAIAVLNRISVDDKFRQRAFNIVKKWIAANK